MKTLAKQKKIKKLFSFTQQQLDWIKNYKHSNMLSSDNAVIISLIEEKNKQKKNAIDEFFSNPTNIQILKNLADR